MSKTTLTELEFLNFQGNRLLKVCLEDLGHVLFGEPRLVGVEHVEIVADPRHHLRLGEAAGPAADEPGVGVILVREESRRAFRRIEDPEVAELLGVPLEGNGGGNPGSPPAGSEGNGSDGTPSTRAVKPSAIRR